MTGFDIEECNCGRGWFDPDEYRNCYTCYLERQEQHIECIWCGRWHSPKYDTCYQCRRTLGRDEAGRNLRLDILMRDDFTCRDCGSRGTPEVDHIKPCSEGGKASPWNLQVLCAECNRVKGRTWGYGCRWDRTRVELMHLYFTFGWRWLDDDDRQQICADARAYGDEFTWHAHYIEVKRQRTQSAVAS